MLEEEQVGVGTEGMLSPQAWVGTDQWAVGYRVSPGWFRWEPEGRSSWGESPAVGMNMPPEWHMEGQPGGYTGLKRKKGFPGGMSGKESTCQCRRHKRQGFNPWVE